MIKTRFGLALGVGAFFAGASMWTVGCGGDDTVVIIISDASTDTTTGPSPDSGPIIDGGMGMGGDTGIGDDDDDAQANDASTDASPDSGVDSGPVDYSAQLLAFQQQLATAYCSNFGNTCTAADAGGSPFSMAICKQNGTRADNSFLEGSTTGVADPSELGHADIVYDATKAAACLADINALNFKAVTGAAYKQATADCFAAIQGTLPIGTACYGSIECSPGLYCKRGVFADAGADAGHDSGAADGGDAGTSPIGSCERLEAANTDCTAYPAGDSCSYRGSQANNAFCDESQNTPICISGLIPNGEACFTDQSCASGLCDVFADNPVCIPTADFTKGCCVDSTAGCPN